MEKNELLKKHFHDWGGAARRWACPPTLFVFHFRAPRFYFEQTWGGRALVLLGLATQRGEFWSFRSVWTGRMGTGQGGKKRFWGQLGPGVPPTGKTNRTTGTEWSLGRVSKNGKEGLKK